ncbi:G-protein coupled receptor moody-like [Patiria miniata]|uniref:G-protein coupled receptors family 1 profile domain-containing protein n=1 Tax=Patiria miniata TaxID=46514 RepID=A0A914AMB6_PATMI|nr:G-protein coupled receptor moody-like [Patiria miniata]
MQDPTPTKADVPVSSVYDSFAEKQLLAALYSLICLMGVVGNSSVLLAVILSRKPRTTTNVFVVNLAVADLLSCLNLPIMILAVLSDSREDLLVSESLCAVEGFLLLVCVWTSLNNITIFAVYRAFITRRKNRSRLFNRRRLAALVVTTWLVPFAVGLVPTVMYGFSSYGYDDKLSTCTFSPASEGTGAFSRITTALFYPVQLTVTFASYAVILYTVRQHVGRVDAIPKQPLAVVSGVMSLTSQSRGPQQLVHEEVPGHSQQLRAPTSNLLWSGTHRSLHAHPLPTRSSTDRRQARRQSRRNIDINLSLFLVVFFFVICCGPYPVLLILLGDKSNKVVPFFAAILVSNSCINPVIYTARHPDFKTVIRCILLCRLSKIPMKSAFLRRILSRLG